MSSRLRVLTKRTDLAAIRDQWDRLETLAQTPLLALDYVDAFVSAYADEDNMHVVVLEDEGRLRAAAPLRRVRRSGVEWLEFFDQPVQEVHAGFLHDSNESSDQLCRGLLGLGYPLHLVRVPVGAPIVQSFSRLSASRACLCRIMPGISTATVTFTDGPLESAMSPTGLRRLRRSERKAHASGEVRYSYDEVDEEGVASVMDVIVQVEASGWKGRAGTSLRDDPPMRAFFTEVALRAARRRELVVTVMTIDGEPAAVRLATNRFGFLWDHKIGFDDRFSQAAPGLLLTQATLLESKARGNRGHVFLGNHEEWQDRWQPHVTETCTMKIFPVSLRGGGALLAEAAGYVARRWRRGTPGPAVSE